MAEALAIALLGPDVRVESCGVYEGIVDPFVPIVLQEIGLPMPARSPRTFASVPLERFDRVVALTAEAASEARLLGAHPAFWDTPNPTEARGSDEEILAAYRVCRDALREKIVTAFHPDTGTAPAAS